MTIDDKITVEKLQYDCDREAAKTWTLLSNKIDKYEYVTGEDENISPPDQSRMIEQAKFTYSALGKALETKWKNK